MLKKLVLFALVAVVVALSLSACSGNVANHKANCEEYNKNFEHGEALLTAKPWSRWLTRSC